MARADTITKLPLDRWADILGIMPLHFSGVISNTSPLGSSCGRVWFQYPWQAADAVSREDVAEAIMMAEEAIERQTGYRLLPSWETDERVIPSQPGVLDLINTGFINPRGFRPSTSLRWGHFISGGVKAQTVLQAGASVWYSDQDGDGYEESAVVQISTTGVTDEEEVAIYFPASATGLAGDERWRVLPLRAISIDAAHSLVTVTMWKHQLVRPELWGQFNPDSIDGDDQDQFLPSVDVYRTYNDPQTQVDLLWQPQPTLCSCGSTGCPMCVLTTQTGCLVPVDPRKGRVSYDAATWDATDEEFDPQDLSVARSPDQLRTWYRAGLRDMRRTWPDYQMDPEMERAVVYLSLTYLDRPMCGCHNLEAAWRRWTEDLSVRYSDQTISKSYQTTRRMLDNPFGRSRGAVYAWEVVNREERTLGRAVQI